MSPQRHLPHLRTAAALLSVLLGFPSGILSAQEASPAPVATKESSSVPKKLRAGETLVLSPFVVSTSGDIGYLAQNSLSGSRLNSSLGDLAVPSTAFTQELLRDIAVTNVADLAEYMASTKIDYPEGDSLFIADDSRRFRIRGLPAFNYSVNFFETKAVMQPMTAPSSRNTAATGRRGTTAGC